MRNILLLVHSDAGEEARFQAALDLTRALGGHLTCLEVAVLPRVVLEAALLSDGVLSVDDMTGASTRIEERLATEDVTWDWIKVTGDIEPCVAEAAPLADLLVLPSPADGATAAITVPGLARLLAHARRPALVVPDRLERFALERPALVAWDGSIGVATALAAAIPLLRISGDATLLEVGREPLDVPAEEAAVYLSRHGIRANVVRRATRRRAASGVGDVIRRFAAEGRYGYVVMGSFGRSPLSEALFGGVTLAMLDHIRLPLFVAR